MKIVIDARILGEFHGGIGRYSKNILQNLVVLNNEKNKYFVFVNKKDKKVIEEINLPKNWEVIYVNFSHYSFTEQIKLLFLLNKIKSDLVHFTHFNIPVLYKKKFIVTIHDLSMHKKNGLNSTTKNPFVFFVKRIGYKLAFNIAIKNSIKIVAPSLVVKNEICKKYKVDENKVVVIYEGVDSKFYTLKKYKTTYDNYFFYAGSAYPHKNLDRAIEGFLDFNKSGKYKFVITGLNNKFAIKLKQKISNDNIVVLGFVEEEELISLMKNAIAFIFPSTMEGFGLPGLEAMASKTLVACSNISIFKEIYENNVIYFNPFDFSSISKVLLQIVELDHKKRKLIIEKAYKQAQKFSWEKCTKETLKLYESCNNI